MHSRLDECKQQTRNIPTVV